MNDSSRSSRVLAVIPARYASTRFPGKPLVDIGGKSMIRRVVEQALAAKAVNRAIVATDDRRVFEHVRAFGGEAVMTRPDHRSGTDRCAEVAAAEADFDIVINVQGDEPFIAPGQIDVAAQLVAGPTDNIGTLVTPIREIGKLFNPNIVKVVINRKGQALYFSRHAVPYQRSVEQGDWLHTGHVFYQHIGLYAFRRAILLAVTQLEPSELEQGEALEQLRWLDHGYSIQVGYTESATLGIDHPEDLEKAMQYLQDYEKK